MFSILSVLSVNVCWGIKPKLVLKDPDIIKYQTFLQKIFRDEHWIMVWINQIYPELYLKHTNKENTLLIQL